jgi:hypothetical protein
MYMKLVFMCIEVFRWWYMKTFVVFKELVCKCLKIERGICASLKLREESHSTLYTRMRNVRLLTDWWILFTVWLGENNVQSLDDENCVNAHVRVPSEQHFEFYVLLTVHLGSVLVNNQLDAQLFFRVYLFQFSTCLEHPCAHHQENLLY